MTKTTTSSETQKNVLKLQELRLVVKTLVEAQKKSKMSKSTVTRSSDMSILQSQIAFQRQEISKHSAKLEEIRSSLSKIPYGLNNLTSKIKQISNEIDQVKASYQVIVVEQRGLKVLIQHSKCKTVDSLSNAQKEKAANVVLINEMTKKRQILKQKYKKMTDVLYFKEEASKAA